MKLYLASQPGLVHLFLALREIFSSAAVVPRHPSPVQFLPGRTILFVDGSTPQSDRDAGALSIVQFMQLFADHGWQVHLWPFDQLDRSPARSDLEKKGIQVILSSRRSDAFDDWIVRNPGLYDVVFVSRPALAAFLLPSLRRCTATFAYYGHDLHGERFQQEAMYTGHRELLFLSRQYSKLEQLICAAADCSYYPSAEEVLVMKRAVPSAKIKELPPYAFDHLHLELPCPPANAQLLFVGNFDHIPNLDAALWLLDQIWPWIRGRLPSAHLTIAGARPPASLARRAESLGGEVTITGWIPDQYLHELYRTTRIVVVPLLFGAGVKHKVVAAIMKGCPVVTTDIGLQGLPELEDVVGLANNPREFAKECERLVVEDVLWFARANAARQALASRFSCDSMWRALEDLHTDT